VPKLKKEIFARPTRFTHRFGDKDDPWVMPEQYFDFTGPSSPKAANAPKPGPFGIKDKGLHVHTPPQSPVSKFRGGHASFGPQPDRADAIAEPLPPSTRERRTTGPTAEPLKKLGKGKNNG
jgi:hypothetical protein